MNPRLTMEPVYLLDLAARKSEWLAARQSVVAGNIANADTPGYKAKDLTGFADVLNQTQLTLSFTNASHITSGGPNAIDGARDAKAPWDVSETGNSVGIEDELLKAGDISREYSLTTNIVKSFHAMLMTAVKE